MLYVHASLKDRLDKALQFAYRLDKEHNLLANLYRMGQSWSQKPYVCFLYSDFAPHSFGFRCYDLIDCMIHEDREGDVIISPKMQAKCWMNGGLIYHGPLEDGQESEPFSVQLTKHDGWSIHT
jgi:hypothetical protein